MGRRTAYCDFKLLISSEDVEWKPNQDLHWTKSKKVKARVILLIDLDYYMSIFVLVM